MADDGRIQARAVVVVTMEVAVGGAWGADCTVAQVYRQATEMAESIVRRAFEKEPGRVRIVGMKARSVSTQEEG